MRREYASQANAYEKRWASYLDRTWQAVRLELPTLGAGRILDVGCGTGHMLRALAVERPSAEVFGVDVTEEMVRIARAGGGRGRSAVADAHALPFARAAFDLVVSSSSLHHWHDPPAALLEVARVTRPGGVLILTDWTRDDLACRAYARLLRVRYPAIQPLLGGAELAGLLEGAGFTVLQTRRYRAGLLWGMMILRAERRGTSAP